MRLNAWFQVALDRWFAEPCAACAASAVDGHFLCAGCQAALPAQPQARWLGDPPVLALAPYLYLPPISASLIRFKYHQRPQLARHLARPIVPLLRRLDAEACCFVPVPLHPTRLVERGFNQAALLAKALAKARGAALQPRLLCRQRARPSQSQQRREQRQHNVAGSFALAQRAPRSPVILVDDVLTTGATAGACLNALRAAGVTVRGVVTVAQTPPRHSGGRRAKPAHSDAPLDRPPADFFTGRTWDELV